MTLTTAIHPDRSIQDGNIQPEIPQTIEDFLDHETDTGEYCLDHDNTFSSKKWYLSHLGRMHGGILCQDHNSFSVGYQDLFEHFLRDHVGIILETHVVELVYSIFSKLDPVFEFTSSEKLLILHKIEDLDITLKKYNKPSWMISKVFIALLYLQKDSPKMREARKLGFKQIELIFKHCLLDTYRPKTIRNLLQLLDFDWQSLRYSLKESYSYYSQFVFTNSHIRTHTRQVGIEIELYQKCINSIFDKFLQIGNSKGYQRFIASDLQFVYVCIETFAEILNTEIYRTTGDNFEILNRDLIVDAVTNQLSQYPYISQKQLKTKLCTKKSHELRKYLLQHKDIFIQIARDVIPILSNPPETSEIDSLIHKATRILTLVESEYVEHRVVLDKTVKKYMGVLPEYSVQIQLSNRNNKIYIQYQVFNSKIAPLPIKSFTRPLHNLSKSYHIRLPQAVFETLSTKQNKVFITLIDNEVKFDVCEN